MTHHPQPLGDLIGLTVASTTSVSTLGAVVAQIQQAAPAGDLLTTVYLTAAITSLVGALVFVHRLLMLSEREKLAEVKAGHLVQIAGKDQVIGVLTDQNQRMEVALADSRIENARLNQQLMLAVQGKPLPGMPLAGA